MNNLTQFKKDVQKLKDLNKAKVLARFFKTGPGEYGEGDVFLGITVLKQRQLAKKYKELSLFDLQKLITSKIHEERLTTLLILIEQYNGGDNVKKRQIFAFYLKNIQYVNNWDLVDLSAPKILGNWLLNKKDRKILYKLSKSKNIWQNRIAMLSTLELIKNNDFFDALKLAKIFLKHEHDLIHKAVGWMLREVGKRNKKIQEDFLKKYAYIMPRTMLRYAVEKFSLKKRKFYLGLKYNKK